jgi:hypothetical protein
MRPTVADGARRGPRIQAVPGTAEFICQYHAALASLLKPKPGTLMTLIAEFKASAEFRRLSPPSVRSYLSYIKLIEDEFGDLPLAALSDRRIRGEFKGWRDRFAKYTSKGRSRLAYPRAYSLLQQRSRTDRVEPLRRWRSALLGGSNRQDMA